MAIEQQQEVETNIETPKSGCGILGRYPILSVIAFGSVLQSSSACVWYEWQPSHIVRIFN